MPEETSRTYHGVAFGERRAQQESMLERLRSQANQSHQLLVHSHRAIGRGSHAGRAVDDGAARRSVEGSDRRVEDDAREARARDRLLEWEASDLASLVPHEMGTTRRQFAVALYETIRLAAALGMSDDRLHYHVRYALQQFLRPDA